MNSKIKCLKGCFATICISFLWIGCTPSLDTPFVTSPDGSLSVALHLDSLGRIYYEIKAQEQEVIESSRLGVVTTTQHLDSALSLKEVSDEVITKDHYTMYHGKKRDIGYEARTRTITLEGIDQGVLAITFNVSDDGVAFQYNVTDGAGQKFEVEREITHFTFTDQAKMWAQPMSKAKTGWKRTNPSYEEEYVQGAALSTHPHTGAGWAYPALFQMGEVWALVSETAVTPNNCATRLYNTPGAGGVAVGYPTPEEVWPDGGLKPVGESSWQSPWRIVAIGSLAEVVESTLGTDLALPAIEMDTDFVHPGVASWSWAVMKDDSTIYPVQRNFIDYAATMSWDYCLIDADWDRKIGYDSIASLVRYADKKGVGLFLWYNSSGSWNDTPYTPKSMLIDDENRRREFERLQSMGIKGIKVDFFGGDGQSMIRYYHKIMQDAAEYGLMLNFHGATLPRGWHRTYPHLMTVEAIKGFEFITFTQDFANRAPGHCATIPFTRNVFDPMDFTPMSLGDNIPNINRVTTQGFELALPTLFTSGIQHIAEIPSGMAKMPLFVIDYLRDIPVVWDETRFIAGFPGKEVALARRHGDVWYVMAINGENHQKHLLLEAPYLSGKAGYIIKDDQDLLMLEKTKTTWPAEGKVDIVLPPYGGLVMKLGE